MTFEWDAGKARINERKHGITFESAALIFEDPLHLISFDRADPSTGEGRWHAIGRVSHDGRQALLVVAHVYREDTYGQEIIRIISARAARNQEIRRYQQQEVD